MAKLNVCIVGGGLSGLTAAYELYNQLGNNVNITILERELQLGGRIFTKKFKGCYIELGAQFFIHDGRVHHLLHSLDLGHDIIPLGDDFISFYHNRKIYPRKKLPTIGLFKTKEGAREKERLLEHAKEVSINENLISCSFDEWYRNNIGEHLISFWNRLLISIGVRDIKSINAYFGLILINVFFGQNYLLKSGLQQLITKLSEKLTSFGCEIITGTECISILETDNKYKIIFKKNNKTNEKSFHKVITSIQPKDLLEIWDTDVIRPLEKIDGHPMALYVIKLDIKLWEKTWGLIISKKNSSIYALCDWKNVTDVDGEAPILAICSHSADNDEIISELRNLFPKLGSQCNIIFEKKWTVGLHQPNAHFFKISKMVSKGLPKGIYLAGDWMVLPALEGAVISGMKAAEALIKEM